MIYTNPLPQFCFNLINILHSKNETHLSDLRTSAVTMFTRPSAFKEQAYNNILTPRLLVILRYTTTLHCPVKASLLWSFHFESRRIQIIAR
jgi:hypothetical protein